LYISFAFKRFSIAKGFLKNGCGFFEIGLFMSSDTYKGKATYIRISQDPTQAGSHWEFVVVL